MKFYGIQLGCTRVFKAYGNYEVIAVTSFSEESTTRSVNELSKIADKVEHEGPYEDANDVDPDISRIASDLNAKLMWSHHTYHYLVDVSKLKEFNKVLHKVFPKKYYIQLRNEVP